MKNPGFQFRVAWLVLAAMLAVGGAGLAQPTEKAGNKSAARTKPQVIYHLPSSSNYAATLHSQAKGQNNNPPAEGPTPGRQETATPTPPGNVIKRSKASNRPARPPSLKSNGPGNSPANKARKK
jgi:lipoprotein-anchoring transpeptidase ErfK/SrfK